MGVLPCQFKSGESAKSLGLTGKERFSIRGTEGGITPGQDVILVITQEDGRAREVALKLRVDTPIEVEYFKHGGILPYVLRSLVAQA
jgi:aconitate hydratase